MIRAIRRVAAATALVLVLTGGTAAAVPPVSANASAVAAATCVMARIMRSLPVLLPGGTRGGLAREHAAPILNWDKAVL